MDSASSIDGRLLEIVDRLLASASIDASDRAFLEQAKADLQAPPTITFRHDPRTMPEPTVASLQFERGDR